MHSAGPPFIPPTVRVALQLLVAAPLLLLLLMGLAHQWDRINRTLPDEARAAERRLAQRGAEARLTGDALTDARLLVDAGRRLRRAARVERRREGLELLAMALARDPLNAAAWFAYGEAALRLGQQEVGRKALLTGQRLDPGFLPLQLEALRLHALTGDNAMIERTLDHVVQRRDGRLRREVLPLLQQLRRSPQQIFEDLHLHEISPAEARDLLADMQSRRREFVLRDLWQEIPANWWSDQRFVDAMMNQALRVRDFAAAEALWLSTQRQRGASAANGTPPAPRRQPLDVSLAMLQRLDFSLAEDPLRITHPLGWQAPPVVLHARVSHLPAEGQNAPGVPARVAPEPGRLQVEVVGEGPRYRWIMARWLAPANQPMTLRLEFQTHQLSVVSPPVMGLAHVQLGRAARTELSLGAIARWRPAEIHLPALPEPGMVQLYLELGDSGGRLRGFGMMRLRHMQLFAGEASAGASGIPPLVEFAEPPPADVAATEPVL